MTTILSLPATLLRLAPRKPWIYLTLWIIWLGVLWYLSSDKTPQIGLPKIRHFDKVLHFGYFACGAIVLAGYFLNIKKSPKPALIILIAFLIGAAVGAVDEHRQSMVEGRFGHDPWDWAADCLGSIAGAACMVLAWKKWRPSRPQNK